MYQKILIFINIDIYKYLKIIYKTNISKLQIINNWIYDYCKKREMNDDFNELFNLFRSILTMYFHFFDQPDINELEIYLFYNKLQKIYQNNLSIKF